MSERALPVYSQLDCGSVVSITWRDIVVVAVLLGVRGDVLWDGVGLGGAGAKGGTCHTQYKPISIIINHKFIRLYEQFLSWGTSRSAKMDSQFCAT